MNAGSTSIDRQSDTQAPHWMQAIDCVTSTMLSRGTMYSRSGTGCLGISHGVTRRIFFQCITACPKGVAPMNQIMRLRRRAGNDFKIEDRNNGERHEASFVSLIRQYGLLNEAELLPRSYGGDSPLAKFKPSAAQELASSLPVIAKALLRRKVTPAAVLKPHKLARADRDALKRIYDEVEGREERTEFNLYISGKDEDR